MVSCLSIKNEHYRLGEQSLCIYLSHDNDLLRWHFFIIQFITDMTFSNCLKLFLSNSFISSIIVSSFFKKFFFFLIFWLNFRIFIWSSTAIFLHWFIKFIISADNIVTITKCNMTLIFISMWYINIFSIRFYNCLW